MEVNRMFQDVSKSSADQGCATTVLINVPDKPPVVKITIEIPGQDPVVMEGVEDYLVFVNQDDRSSCVSMTSLAHLIYVHGVIKEQLQKFTKGIFG